MAIAQPPTARLLCHCTICQGLYRAPYADVTVMLAKHCNLITRGTVTFSRHKSPPALDRGVCSGCAKPVVGFLRLPGLPQLAFLPSNTFPKDMPKPHPIGHIWYRSRVADVNDDLPKHAGPIASNLALVPSMIGLIRAG